MDRGCVWTGGGVHSPAQTATDAVGTHPTGMHSCFRIVHISMKLLHVHMQNVEDSIKLCKVLLERLGHYIQVVTASDCQAGGL